MKSWKCKKILRWRSSHDSREEEILRRWAPQNDNKVGAE